jgi:hypothetical protein
LKTTIITSVFSVIALQLILNHEKFNLAVTVFSSFAGVLVSVFVINWRLNKTKSIPDSDGAILGQKEFEFSEDNITYKTVNSEGISTWKAIKKLEESSQTFYLYTDTNMAIMVPKRVFKDKPDENAFKSLVRKKINTA